MFLWGKTPTLLPTTSPAAAGSSIAVAQPSNSIQMSVVLAHKDKLLSNLAKEEASIEMCWNKTFCNIARVIANGKASGGLFAANALSIPLLILDRSGHIEGDIDIPSIVLAWFFFQSCFFIIANRATPKDKQKQKEAQDYQAALHGAQEALTREQADKIVAQVRTDYEGQLQVDLDDARRVHLLSIGQKEQEMAKAKEKHATDLQAQVTTSVKKLERANAKHMEQMNQASTKHLAEAKREQDRYLEMTGSMLESFRKDFPALSQTLAEASQSLKDKSGKLHDLLKSNLDLNRQSMELVMHQKEVDASQTRLLDSHQQLFQDRQVAAQFKKLQSAIVIWLLKYDHFSLENLQVPPAIRVLLGPVQEMVDQIKLGPGIIPSPAIEGLDLQFDLTRHDELPGAACKAITSSPQSPGKGGSSSAAELLSPAPVSDAGLEVSPRKTKYAASPRKQAPVKQSDDLFCPIAPDRCRSTGCSPLRRPNADEDDDVFSPSSRK